MWNLHMQISVELLERWTVEIHVAVNWKCSRCAAGKMEWVYCEPEPCANDQFHYTLSCLYSRGMHRKCVLYIWLSNHCFDLLNVYWNVVKKTVGVVVFCTVWAGLGADIWVTVVETKAGWVKGVDVRWGDDSYFFLSVFVSFMLSVPFFLILDVLSYSLHCSRPCAVDGRMLGLFRWRESSVTVRLCLGLNLTIVVAWHTVEGLIVI